MSKRTRRQHKGRQTAGRHVVRAHGGRTSPRPPAQAREPDLVRDVAAAVADDDPLSLLRLVSSLLAALDPRGAGPFGPEREVPSRDELVRTFLEVDLPETSALLAAIAPLTGDAVLRRRVHHELASRAHVLPDWLVGLHRAESTGRVVEIVHVLGDGDNLMLGVRLPGGHEFVVVVYIDHNMGTLVKDAFVVPGSVDDLVERMLSIAPDDPDTDARDVDPADARARITEAVGLGAISFPPFETETWPACRPLVEWAAAMLPAGGTGYRRPEWDTGAVAALAESFFASPFAAGSDSPDHRGLLESLLWFGTDYGPGDPMRWSPTAVEILLVDWLPRKIVAEPAYLAKAPDLLRAFIRFCHHERGIRAELTAQTLDAVGVYERDYQRVIRSPRPQGPAALLAKFGAFSGDTPWQVPVDTPTIIFDGLRSAVGGQDALDSLQVSPLPDEPFAWDAIPADVHDRVSEVLTLIDRCCDELLDAEYRTACRRFLAAAAAGDPEIFRRSGQAATAAAAVCWTIGKANTLFEPRPGERGLLVKDLKAHFGIRKGSPSQRSAPMLRAMGAYPGQYGTINLGSPDYLTAARRARIITLRDLYSAGG